MTSYADHGRRLADAVHRAGLRGIDLTGAGPTLQRGTVTAVGAGTVVITGATGGYPAVTRLASYAHPVVGDVVYFERTAAGGWICHGPAGGDSGQWQPLALDSAYTTRFATPQAVRSGRLLRVRGSFTPSSGSLTTTAALITFATLPIGWWPLTTQYAPLVGNSAVTARLAAQPTGELQYTITQPPPATAPTWLDLCNATISLD